MPCGSARIARSAVRPRASGAQLTAPPGRLPPTRRGRDSVSSIYVKASEGATLSAAYQETDATLRNLELLGEAARHVPEEARARAPDIPWRRIVGVRNVLIHGYLSIDNDIIWDIVRNEVEKLQLALEKLDAENPASDGGAKGGER